MIVARLKAMPAPKAPLMPVGRASDKGSMMRNGSVGAVGVNGSLLCKSNKTIMLGCIN